MKLIETPPPTLLRAWFATALDNLPSVPSVILPIVSLIRNNQALPLLNAKSNKYSIFSQFEIINNWFQQARLQFDLKIVSKRLR
jgi:hypothetical protein